MRRVLFVDDDPETRDLYEQLHTYWGIQQEVHTACGGRDALVLLSREKYDVIVSDLSMPDMSGLEFLEKVIELQPEAARIVISGHADRLKAAEALNVAHRYFSKPFRLELLASLLEQLCQYHHLLPNERVRRMIFKTGALPVLPATWVKLTELLDSPDADIHDIAEVVEQDPGLTSRLLHTVNSAYFGIARKVISCAEAIQIVGLELVRGLMLGMKVFNFYQSNKLVRSVFGNIWDHSLRTAVGARKLAGAEGQPVEIWNVSFTAGLLHDVGKLVLAGNAEHEYRAIIELAKTSGTAMDRAEAANFGCDHAQVGAYLFALWGFPEAVVDAVADHHRLANARRFTPALAIHLAQNLDPHAGREEHLNQELLQQIGLEHRIPVWKQILAEAGAHHRAA